MEKSTDSSTSSTTSSSSSSNVGSEGSTTTGSSNATTTATSEANQEQQQQILQKHRHNHQNGSAASSTSTPTKNQLNNSLGCGPSSSTATTAKSSSLDRGGCGMIVGGNSSNIMSSLNNTTMGHQSSNTTTSSTTTTANNATTLSNPASLPGSTASTFSSSSSPSSTSQMAPINLNISTTTGGSFSVSVDPQITVESLKKIIAKKLKVAKDRICLLHREKELQDGLLKENNLMDGSKIILIPNVETGLLAQRPENTVMQALESLNDSQVNDFLSGKTPLNLSMRLGDHMMLIQLQLSTVNPVNGVSHNGANCSSSSSRQRSNHHHHHHHRSSRTAATASAATQTAGTTTTANHSHYHHHHHHHHHSSNTAVAGSSTTTTTLPPTAVSVATTAQNVTAVRKLELETTCQTPRNNSNTSTLIAPHLSRTTASTINGSASSLTPSSSITTVTKNSDLSSFLSKRDYESLQNIVKSIAMAQPSRLVQQSIINTNNTSKAGVQSSSSSTAAIPPVSASSTTVPVVATPTFHAASEAVLLEQSPIKSLSNLVSSPIKTTAIKNIPSISNNSSSSSSTNNVAIGPHTASISAVSAPSSNVSVAAANSTMCQDPIAAKLTSCLCTRLNSGLASVSSIPHATAKQCIETACISQQQQQQTSPQQHHHHQLQPHATRTSTNTIMTSTPNYKSILTPGSIIQSPNGPTNSSTSSSRSSSSLHKTAHNPISRKHRHHHHHHHHHHHYHHPAGVQQLSSGNNQKIITSTSTPVKVMANDSGFNSGDDSSLNVSTTTKLSSSSSTSTSPTNNISQMPVKTPHTKPIVVAPLATSTTSAASSNSTATSTATPIELDDSGIVSDSRTLAEASRNLTQTLRKLSKEVFTNKIDFSTSEETPRKSGSGAVIESMKNHGKGIYSGTFSGTLNPALQDRYGRPKRDISTVIHILNDLLSATPQYHRGARISFEAPSTSAAAAASVAAASGSTGTVHHSSRSKHLSSKHHQSSHPCVKCIKTHNSSSSTVNLQSSSATNALGTTNHSQNTATSSPICAYGECNGHYVSSKSQSTKTYSCCQQDATTVAATASSTSAVQQHQGGNNSSSSTTASNTTNGHNHHHHHGSSHHHHHHHHQMVDERKVCQCRYRVHAETGERERDYTCQKCATELDNIKTKSKLDQLRLVMQQRKQKREARKLKGAPYGARVVGTTTTTTASGVTDNTASTLTAANSTITTPISVATSTTTPSEVSPNHLVEEVDTAA